jgi:hypothetical protein
VVDSDTEAALLLAVGLGLVPVSIYLPSIELRDSRGQPFAETVRIPEFGPSLARSVRLESGGLWESSGATSPAFWVICPPGSELVHQVGQTLALIPCLGLPSILLFPESLVRLATDQLLGLAIFRPSDSQIDNQTVEVWASTPQAPLVC